VEETRRQNDREDSKPVPKSLHEKPWAEGTYRTRSAATGDPRYRGNWGGVADSFDEGKRRSRIASRRVGFGDFGVASSLTCLAE